jgi:hypothetical protein
LMSILCENSISMSYSSFDVKGGSYTLKVHCKYCRHYSVFEFLVFNQTFKQYFV